MILENKGEKFTLEFDSRPFPIPEGKFEVGEVLGTHIMAIARKWGNDVVIISKDNAGPIVPQKKEEVITPAEKVEEKVEAPEVVDEDLDEDPE